MTTNGRIALLLLGVSALPFPALAQPSAWVYGVAEREAAEGEDVVYLGEGREDTVTLQAKPKQQKQQNPPKTSPPATSTPPASGGSSSNRILVAIVDTGIDLDHSEFTGRIAAGAKCFGTCSGAAASGEDDNGHGTHVAGIIGAAANNVGNTGVAPNVSLLAVKVLDSAGNGPYTAVASGIAYAAQQGADVINMSLGGSSASTTLLAPLKQAAATSVIVAAAGNSGNQYSPNYPAAYATQAGIVGSMIIVGSVNASNQISSFSQTPGSGGCVASGGVTTCLKDVFLVAPGQSIYSSYKGGGYATMSGTSMAAPYVSGVAARVLEQSPYLTPQQVVSILFQSATDLGAKGTDTIYGRGLVNLQAALAPQGSQSVATSGSSTSNFQGTSSPGNARSAGVLAAGLRGSQIAKDVVFFDAYGRDYHTDLTKAAASGMFGLDGMLTQNFGYWRGVSMVGDGYTVSGFVADNAFAEKPHTQISEVVLRASLSENTALIVGHDASPVGQLNGLDLAASTAYDGLFLSASAMNSPYLALTQGAEFAAIGTRLGNGLTLTLGYASAEDDPMAALEDETLSMDELDGYLAQGLAPVRSSENAVAALNWKFAPWGQLGAHLARTNEKNSLLGSEEQGALSVTSRAQTTSFGFGARLDLGNDWTASASWSHGMTDATPVADGLYQSFSGIESEAYGVALAKRGIFGENDALGFAVSRPLHIVSGSALITASTGVTEDREIIYTTGFESLATTTPETDFELGYTASLGDGLSLQASAMYQQDAGGVKGENGIAAFATLKAQW